MMVSKNDLIFIPLGGSGEIGMNCNLYHYEGSWLMIDLGVMFGNSSISPNFEFFVADFFTLVFILVRLFASLLLKICELLHLCNTIIILDITTQ